MMLTDDRYLFKSKVQGHDIPPIQCLIGLASGYCLEQCLLLWQGSYHTIMSLLWLPHTENPVVASSSSLIKVVILVEFEMHNVFHDFQFGLIPVVCYIKLLFFFDFLGSISVFGFNDIVCLIEPVGVT